MPESLRHAVQHLVAEAVSNCQEVLRYMEPDRVRSWERMTLYRATDAADTLDSTSLLVAAYLEHTGASTETPHRYLQCHQQLSRTAGPKTTTVLPGRAARPGCPADPRRKTETASASGSISSGNSMPKLSKIPRRTSSSCGPRHASTGPTHACATTWRLWNISRRI
ncbi:hypothetical protein [Streptomyces abikoensis]|uniref:hypothetical protein n=1 Tax=Streptomyces abikoensis TaxID=97398 RepID=UPI00369C4572